MSNLFDLLKDNKAVQSLLKGEREFVTDDTIGVALLAASSFIKKPQKYNIITSNLYNAQKIYDLLSTFIGEDNCLFYPCDEMMRLDSAVASKEMLAQRLFVMDKLLEKENYILICHAASAMRFVPSPELFENNSIVFEKGKKFDLQELKNTLSKIGYNKVNKIDHSLQFAIRGDILDINSVNYTYPVRIEFFDDEVESIRFFDMSTQESINNVDCVKVIPADEYLVSENEREEIFKKLDEQLKKDLKQSYCKDKDWLMENVRLLKDKLHNSASLSCAPNYYSFFQENYFSILNYSRNATTIIANKTQLYVASKMLLEESTDRFLALFEEGKVLSHIAVYRNIEKVLSTVKTSICTIDEFSKTGKEIIFNVRPIGSTASTLSQAVDLIKNYSSTHEKILISLSNKQQYEVIKNLLIENELEFSELINVSIPKEKIGICISVIDEGFDLINENIAVLSTKELFNYKTKFLDTQIDIKKRLY